MYRNSCLWVHHLKRSHGNSLIVRASSQSIGKIDSKSDEYQFLKKSKVPSLHFQKSLPRLPIPELKKTCERYIAAATPLLTEDELADTTAVVRDFEAGVGAELDKRLREQDKINKHTSYISKIWFDMYLKDRVPLPLNYNPAMGFSDDPSKRTSQLVRATNSVITSLRFMKSLRAGILAPEVYHMNPSKSDTELFRNVTRMLPSSLSWYGAYLFKAFPLDMSQYSSLFNSARVPKPEKDVLVKDESCRHLLVIRKGRLYKVDVLDEKGSILPAEDILKCLQYIISLQQPINDRSVSILTTTRRDTWASTREHLASISSNNAAALKDIDSAVFALCLDDDALADDRVKSIRSYLHGDGLNRWFDKSFNLIISSDGACGLNFEHSWGDGVAVLRYMIELSKDRPFVDSNSSNSSISAGDLVKEIEFTLDSRIEADLAKAKTEFQQVCNSLEYNAVFLETFGKANCKMANLSPDSVMQLAFQVAYHKAFNGFVGTYESCSTAAFKHGRTETIRPNTNLTKEFALAFNKSSPPSRADLIQLMQKCSSYHGKLTKEAAMGEGFDRHLLALRNLALENGTVHKLFTHPSYTKMNYNILSTSTVSSEVVSLGGFGPVVPDGLGIGYSILNNTAGAAVSSYSGKRDGATFVAALGDTLKRFQSLLSTK